MFGIHRMRVRQTVENPDSQFVAMPSTITPAGIELNPQTEPIQEPTLVEEVSTLTETTSVLESVQNTEGIVEATDKNESN